MRRGCGTCQRPVLGTQEFGEGCWRPFFSTYFNKRSHDITYHMPEVGSGLDGIVQKIVLLSQGIAINPPYGMGRVASSRLEGSKIMLPF